ncbi:MAG TPA: right-handed parallel beta-helix repeat-containing protein, partial [Pyrinomonadaceae bacterium]|nr:right-handed parallel beta-helix repeat-containing protein [Pyrinomonadaceae bacterium]
MSAIALVSIISATILVAQDAASSTDARSRAMRFVAPIDGPDPNEGQRVEEPGFLDKAYDMVFGAKTVPTSNLMVTINSCAVDACTPSPTDNDFRRINNAIIGAGSGDTIILNGVFDWTEPFAAADWANGSDYTAATGDDYSILAPAGLNNVTVTANSLGSATIQGPGDLASANLEGVFQFYSGGTNSGWTISNLTLLDFDNAIGFYHAGGPSTVYNGTTITGNHIRIARDWNAVVAPADVNQNIGIHFAYGINQTISNNLIELHGDGVSALPTSSSSEVAMQSNTSGGAVYDGLQITNNEVRVLFAQDLFNPERAVGIWENAHGHFSDVTVSGNVFKNMAVGNNPSINLQTGFRASSHSSGSTTVAFSNNRVEGASIGLQFYNTGATTDPVQVSGSTLANNRTGVLIGNSAGATNVKANFVNNRIAGNSFAAIDNTTWGGGVITAENNWWGCNSGPGGATSAGCPVSANANTGAVTATTFLTLSASALPTFVVSGGSSTITATITNVPDGTPVSFGSANALGSSTGNGDTVGGSKTGTYTAASNNAGYGVATATVDGQTMNANVTIHPKVNSINRKTPLNQQTNLTSVVYEVAFSAPVSNVDDTDFVVTSLSGPPAAITLVSCPSPFDKCDVTVAAGGTSELRLDLVDDNSITRRLVVPLIPLGGPALADGNHTGDQTYIIDVSPPSVTAITKLDTDPTAATSVQFSVSFSEPVTGVDTTDFVVSGTGTATVSSVTGTGPYTVTLTSVASTPLSSTVGINVDDNNSIVDTSLPTGNPLGGPTLTDGDYTGPLYTVDQHAPTGTLTQSIGQPDPTAGMTVNFTVVFTDALAISGFDASDVTVAIGGGTAFGTNTPIVNVSAPTFGVNTTTYTVSISSMDQAGQVTASVGGGSVSDAVGNNADDVVEGDNTVYYTVGLATLVVDDDGLASNVNFPTSCDDLTPTAYTTITSAIAAAAPLNTIKVCPGTYDEDIDVNKPLTLVGADKTTTTIRGQKTGDLGDVSSSTVRLLAAGIDISNFTITREGNNTTDWNSGLNLAGLSIQSPGVAPNAVIHDNIFVGNRSGIDINNNGSDVITVRNNAIDDNRTGMIMRNATDNLTVVENSISNNWTIGVLFLNGGPSNSCKNCAFINNNISGNWYGQIQDRVAAGGFKNFQGNWYGPGAVAPGVITVTATDTAEPGYAAQIPVAYGGAAVPPAGPIHEIRGVGAANLRFNLPLTSGTDTNIQTETGRGTFGFQGAPIVVDGPEVNPIDGWGYVTETPTGTGEFESGPMGAPLGTGSSRISITSGGGQAFGTLNYGGIRMDRMTALRYSSYQVGQASVAPYLAFDFDRDLDDGDNSFQGRLVFEPEIDTPGSVLQSTWQNWDARAGKWWATGGVLAGTCTMATPCTWTSITTAHPNAGIRRVASFGALLFKIGSGPVNTTGFVDNFEIEISTGSTVYDFESDGSPNPTVVSSVRASTPNPSSASSVDFTVTFSEPVIGVDPGDFTLATTGGIASASVTGATTVGPAPSAVWTVTVNTGTGSGDIRLDTSAGGITDVAGNSLTTGFTTGEAYTMDRDLVTVTIDQASGQGDPTNALPINFTVQFSETVTGFDNPATDLTLGGVGTTATITPIDGDTYTVAVTAASGFGFVTVSIPAAVAEDNLGNDNAASTSGDNSVNYTFGSTVLMVDDDGLAIDGDCNALIPNSAYLTIQAAVAASSAGNTIKVCPGNYSTPPTVSVGLANLTITAAEPMNKPLVQASGTADAFDVTATGVTISNLEIQKIGTGDQHHMIRVQANNFTGQGNYIHGPSWQTPNHVSRAFILNAGLTGWLIDGNTIENLRQPAYFTTGSGTVSNNTATGTKGWVNDGGLITFTNNTFGQTCLACDTDIALLAATTSPAYEAFYSAANNLVISTGNNNAHIDVQFTAAADSGRAVTYVDDTAAPGGDGRVGTPHQSIQTAIFKAGPNLVDGTLPGGTVNVAAGLYTEQITVNRQLNILGPNSAIDPNTGSRVAEAVIRAAVQDLDPFDGSNDENSVMVTITNTADGTVIKGFTVDGDNPLLDSNYGLNGADPDAYGGISGNGNINPAANISYNIVKNMGEFGIEVYGDPNAPGVRTNSTISNNKVDNVVGWWYGNAIFAGDNASTNVEDNVVTQSFGGIMIHHFNGQATSRPNSVVDGNTITAFGYPIWFNLHYAYSGNGFTVSNNTINSYIEQDATPLVSRAASSKFEGAKDAKRTIPTRISDKEPANSVGGWGRWIGIKIESVNGLVPAVFTDNNIDGNRALLLSDTPPYTMIDGIRITNPSTTSSNIDVTENNITDTNRGIAHTADALVDITCNNIYGNQIGVYIGSGLDYDGNPESADIGANVNNNNILGNAVFGVQAQTGTSGVNNATGNYWGAADGPGPVGPGTGDNVSTLVNFAGFLTIPSTCSPVAPPPTVTIEQVGPDPTNTSPINFTVTFSEAVTDFDDASDIALSGTGSPTTVVITGGPTVYNVAVSGMTDGTVIADVVAGAATGANGANVASSSLDNTVLYDTTPPTVNVEQKLGQNDPTNASPVEFTVTFYEPTTNFVTGDVNLSASTAPGTLVGTVTGGPMIYNVAVTGMTGSGTVI